MSEYCPWVKIDYRVHALTPAVGHWAFSPSERYLAWVEGPDLRAVQVTELPSMRTVCTLEGADFFSLSWVGDDVLRAVRTDRDRVVISRHAVPDGGALGEVAVPRDSFATSVQTSADGRVALVRFGHYVASDSPPRAFLVGLAGDDVATALPLVPPRAAPAGLKRVPQVECSLSPDGRVVAVRQEAILRGDPVVWFATPGAAPSRLTPLPATASLLGWASPTRVLLHAYPNGSALLAVDRDGPCTSVTTALVGWFVDGSLDLHPERDQLLLCVRAAERGRYRTLALRVRLDGAAPEAIPLSHERAPDGSSRDGGACWDHHGAVVTLTQSPPGVATLTRRHTTRSPGARLAHFKVIGERPVDLALAPSPQRERFVITWRSFDRGPADPVRRLALFAP